MGKIVDTWAKSWTSFRTSLSGIIGDGPKIGHQPTRLEFYTNGVLKAKGSYKAGKLNGDWEWFRKTGVIMRSGSFKNGVQFGTWITYDAKGKVYKRTLITSSKINA